MHKNQVQHKDRRQIKKNKTISFGVVASNTINKFYLFNTKIGEIFDRAKTDEQLADACFDR